MLNAYGIAGISPLGAVGLGMPGAYDSMYNSYMPSTLGYDTSMAMGMPYAYGGYGLDTIMNYYKNMAQTRNDMEIQSLQHTNNMHKTMLSNEIDATVQTKDAIFRKMLSDGDIIAQVDNLRALIEKGDGKGVVEEYKILEDYIFKTYQSAFQENSNKNAHAVALKYIKDLYGNIASATGGGLRNLEQDIDAFCDTSATNKFLQGLRPGHHTVDVDHVKNYIFGRRIDHREEKDVTGKLMYGLGTAAGIAKGGLIGAGCGAASLILCKSTGWLFGAKSFLPKLSSMGKWARIGAIAGIVLAAGHRILNATKDKKD